MKTLLIYGIPKEETERYTEALLAECKTAEQVERVKIAASKDGFHSFRVATFTLGEKPNFTATVAI